MRHPYQATISATILTLFLIALSGCAIFSQDRDTVYVRESGTAHWNLDPSKMTRKELVAQAEKHWAFAVMSENAYHGNVNFPIGPSQIEPIALCNDLPSDVRDKILSRGDPRSGLSELTISPGTTLLEAAQWREWRISPDVVSTETWCKSVEHALAYRIYEREIDGVVEIAVAFRGTVWSYLPNTKSNLRWFIQWPWTGEDANLVVQKRLTRDLANAIVRRYPERIHNASAIRIYSTGHSLGGALAQQFAYAFPPVQYPVKDYPGLKLKQVVVFNPSPVNGWFSVPKELRQANAGNVPISRVFQHGEVLAYLRLLLGYVVPLNDGECESGICLGPKIEEVRYNRLFTEENTPKANAFKQLGSPGESHSMRNLAAGLSSVVGKIPDNYYPAATSQAVATARP